MKFRISGIILREGALVDGYEAKDEDVIYVRLDGGHFVSVATVAKRIGEGFGFYVSASNGAGTESYEIEISAAQTGPTSGVFLHSALGILEHNKQPHVESFDEGYNMLADQYQVRHGFDIVNALFGLAAK